jgi:hypothetical protein
MQKQWAAGAPVIGAAPVSSGRPKRLFRLTGIRRVERSNFFLKRPSEKEKNYECGKRRVEKGPEAALDPSL